MEKRLTPAFVELTQDALLKAFWFKPSLRTFLKQNGISDGALAQWQAEQTKRDYVQWLWMQLLKNERGHNVILSMARSLAEMKHFPDLERKEDTRERIPEAMTAVSRLREAVVGINDDIHDAKEAARRRAAAREEMALKLAAKQSLDKLQICLGDLTSKLGTQEGGIAFERWFYDLAIYFELDARPGYVTNGRQIDGAITVDGTTFLVETKFTKGPIGSPDVDIFMVKIESKADNTMGVLVSMSGFTSGAITAASKQRTPMLLLDHSHIFNLLLAGVMTLPQLIGRVRRHASQTGSSYLAVGEL